MSDLTRADCIEMGFREVSHQTITNSLVLDLGRLRFLNLGCLGGGNEVLFICEKSKAEDDHYSDLICVHNRDYDGLLTKSRLQTIVNCFNCEIDKHEYYGETTDE